MDSPPPEASAASVDSVTHDLQNQSLAGDEKMVVDCDGSLALMELCQRWIDPPKEFERPDFPLILWASHLVGSLPYAQCYGGHQFGMWAGQLGDGWAITLGEVLNSKSERWELQLKGVGKTPYSRFADGLAVLRSSIQEFLWSEAMHNLGIPTTRALCLVTTGKFVTRNMFYECVN
ncbi:unnamed protein product [Malus baccata var. baccata]